MRRWLGVALLFGACSGAPSPGDRSGDAGQAVLSNLTAAELNAALSAKDFLLVDVHIPAADHIAGTDARVAYHDTSALVALVGADLDRKVVLTCMSSAMSGQAGQALVRRGYRNVSHLVGGMDAWVAAGYPVVP